MNYGHGYRKYHNRRTGGFDSKRERDRYQELLLLERAGIIHELKRQVHFQLTPPVREPDTIGPRGGVQRKGKIILQKSEYVADFTYYQDGRFIVEDCKGYKTPEYILKKKFLYHLKGILIHET